MRSNYVDSFGKQTVGNYFGVYLESLNWFKIGNKKNGCYLTTEKGERNKETHLSFPNDCQELWISLEMQLMTKIFSK